MDFIRPCSPHCAGYVGVTGDLMVIAAPTTKKTPSSLGDLLRDPSGSRSSDELSRRRVSLFSVRGSLHPGRLPVYALRLLMCFVHTGASYRTMLSATVESPAPVVTVRRSYARPMQCHLSGLPLQVRLESPLIVKKHARVGHGIHPCGTPHFTSVVRHPPPLTLMFHPTPRHIVDAGFPILRDHSERV